MGAERAAQGAADAQWLRADAHRGVAAGTGERAGAEDLAGGLAAVLLEGPGSPAVGFVALAAEHLTESREPGDAYRAPATGSKCVTWSSSPPSAIHFSW